MVTEDLLSAFDAEHIGTEALLFQTGYLTITEEQELGVMALYEHAQGDGLAGAGGSDECGAHARLHRLGESGGDLRLRFERGAGSTRAPATRG